MEIMEKFLTAGSKSELFDVLVEQCSQMGFCYFVYTPLIGGSGSEKVFRDESRIMQGEELIAENMLIDCPVSWLHRYQEARHVEVDPVIKFVSRSTLPIFWGDANRAEPTNVVFNEAREHGLANGITVTVYGHGGRRAVFSASTDSRSEHWSSHRMQTAALVQLTANYVSEALQKLENSGFGSLDLAFSVREKDCLQWAANGKTSWEIAQILKISERTVIFHLTNASRKLGATNRRQAVVRALSLRLINP